MCATVLERRQQVTLMSVGIACTVAATITWITFIWFENPMSSSVERAVARIGGTFTVAAAWAALAGLLSLPRFDRRLPVVVRWTTVGVAAALGLQIVCMIWWMRWIALHINDDILVRGGGVLAILIACGSVVTPILWKVQAMRRGGTLDPVRLKVKIGVECPRCHTKQSLVSGLARCGTCGLHITITVEEPRCACGYALYHLESDCCPECGRTIDEQDRWFVTEAATED
jgi:hypothetical protein